MTSVHIVNGNTKQAVVVS